MAIRVPIGGWARAASIVCTLTVPIIRGQQRFDRATRKKSAAKLEGVNM
jgi:hypothetical protein